MVAVGFTTIEVGFSDILEVCQVVDSRVDGAGALHNRLFYMVVEFLNIDSLIHVDIFVHSSEEYSLFPFEGTGVLTSTSLHFDRPESRPCSLAFANPSSNIFRSRRLTW